MDAKEIKVGDSVTFIDEHRNRRPALVTQVWTPTLINCVFVQDDVNRTCQYGRQIDYKTSVPHVSSQGDNVVGYVWE